MLHRAVILLLITTFNLGIAVPGGAQTIVKPRSTSDRLPRPASVTATQQPDGRIRVVWTGVEGATAYKLVRSVPPAGSKPISLPAPSDTQYVDADVKAGSTYYYLVSAVNQAGIEGLKAGSAPVTATTASGTLRASGDAENPTDNAGGGLPPVPAPSDVVAQPFPYLQPTVTWKSTVTGARFLVERVRIRDAKAAWEQIPGSADGLWSCCEAQDRQAPAQVDLVYRVTTVEPAPSTRRSQPAVSDTITNWEIKTSPPTLGALSLVAGETKQVGPNNYRWMALDTLVVRVWGNGLVTAKQCCRTYVIGSNLSNDAVGTAIWRVDVKPKQ